MSFKELTVERPTEGLEETGFVALCIVPHQKRNGELSVDDVLNYLYRKEKECRISPARNSIDGNLLPGLWVVYFKP